jgi:hypothetical protein
MTKNTSKLVKEFGGLGEGKEHVLSMFCHHLHRAAVLRVHFSDGKHKDYFQPVNLAEIRADESEGRRADRLEIVYWGQNSNLAWAPDFGSYPNYKSHKASERK